MSGRPPGSRYRPPEVDEEVARWQIPAERRCLGCGKMFRSDGPQVRICRKCGKRDPWRE